jgi:hypothetical protein
MPEPDFDPSSLHAGKLRSLAKSGGKAFGFMPDDGSGNVEIFRIENFELAPQDPAAYGMFFVGDSYVIKYTYEKNGRQNYILYSWQVCGYTILYFFLTTSLSHSFMELSPF